MKQQLPLWLLRPLLFFTITAFGLALSAASVLAGKGMGETSSYAREMGFESRFFYVPSGNGVGQIEYICRAFAGGTDSNSTATATWQVQRFAYNSSNQLTDIRFAGDNDDFNQICDDRTTLDYS